MLMLINNYEVTCVQTAKTTIENFRHIAIVAHVQKSSQLFCLSIMTMSGKSVSAEKEPPYAYSTSKSILRMGQHFHTQCSGCSRVHYS